MDVRVKFRVFFGLDCNFTSWLLFLCAKASDLLSFQFCQFGLYVPCTMILMI